MRILLDENLPRQLARALAGHEVATVSGIWVARYLALLAMLPAHYGRRPARRSSSGLS